MMEQLLFYTFAGIAVVAALAVISVRNPVYAALFLVLTFVSSAGVWALLEAEFLAITLILVYVGAVMVLFLFVVMMLDVNVEPMKEGFARYLPVGLIVALIMLGEMFLVIGAKSLGAKFEAPVPHELGYSNTKEIGELLYTKYLYPFEIAAVILLVAIIAAIALTLRKRPEVRKQDPGKQVLVKKADRLRVVKMATEQAESDT